jgi:hypothetical protein
MVFLEIGKGDGGDTSNHLIFVFKCNDLFVKLWRVGFDEVFYVGCMEFTLNDGGFGCPAVYRKGGV